MPAIVEKKEASSNMVMSSTSTACCTGDNQNKKEKALLSQKQQQNLNNDDVDDDDDASIQQRWDQWMPMDRELYATLQLVQLCMLQKVDEMFTHAGIPYWLCGGTLMGAIRHGGFIPHDDDIDLECYQADLNRIASLPLDPPLYTGFIESAGNWEGHPVAKLDFFDGLLKVDVFPRPSSLPTSSQYFPSRDEIFPLCRYNFCNIQVWGPNLQKCTTYLDRCYGKDWLDTVCVYNHDYNWCYNTGFDPRKEVVTLKEYNNIVTKAGIRQPRAQANAKLTFQHLQENNNNDNISWDSFVSNYKKYCFERTIRRNRTEAEYRERQREEEEKQRGRETSR